MRKEATSRVQSNLNSSKLLVPCIFIIFIGSVWSRDVWMLYLTELSTKVSDILDHAHTDMILTLSGVRYFSFKIVELKKHFKTDISMFRNGYFHKTHLKTFK